ncbi:MAG: cytochrome b N-terminal domain-containing protein [Candidatus Kapaibacterium sp.]
MRTESEYTGFFSSRMALSMTLGALVAVAVTGLIMASFYKPDTAALRDETGARLSVRVASRNHVDVLGDTIRRVGDWYASPPDAMNDSLRRRDRDPELFGRDVSIPASWYSINVRFERQTEFGAILRATHARATDTLILCIAWMMLSALIQGVRHGVDRNRWQVLLAVYVTALLVAWCGSILPWDVRARQAYGIGTHLLHAYVPGIGPAIAGYFWNANDYREPDLMRVFLLHAFVLAPILLIGLNAVRKRMQDRIVRVRGIVAGMSVPLLWASIGTTDHLPDRGLALERTNVTPEWYLAVPSKLLAAVPEDFAVMVVLGAIVSAVALGFPWPSTFWGRFARGGAFVFATCYVAAQLWFLAGTCVK